MTPLFVTHRLDAATSGVLVMARDASFARAFNDALRNRRVKKLYRALTLAPPPLGTLEHWVVPSTEGPRRHLMHRLREGDVPWEQAAAAEEAAAAAKEEEEAEEAEEEARLARREGNSSDAASSSSSSSSSSAAIAEIRQARRQAKKKAKMKGCKKAADPFVHPDGRQRCVLRVLSCEAINLELDAAEAENDDDEKEGDSQHRHTTGSGGNTVTAYESTVELITGRTHQIRSQFAAEGVPLVVRQLYKLNSVDPQA